MANPSLQIGNSNWAIKEDDLLGYSTVGTNYLPKPMTMTRASAGTRVNPEGLVENVELLGSELVTDGDFLLTGTQAENTTGTYWITGSGTTISSGVANVTLSGAALQQAGGIFVSGNTFIIEFTISNYVSGSIAVSNVSPTTYRSANGTYTLTATGAGGNFKFFSSSFVGSVSNISVKEYAVNDLARVDYDGTASSLLVEPQRTNLIPYSEDFSSWTTTGSATVTPNTTISPDGTQNADTLNLLAGSYFYKVLTTGAGTFTLSCYVKVASGTLDFKMQSFGADGAISSGVFTATTNWQRFEFTTTITANSGFYPVQVSGLVGGDFQIWGAQVEEGSYPTSYIKTQGATVTRNADQYEKTGISNLIGQTEGTVFVDVDFDTLSGLNMFLSIRPDASNKIEIYRDGNIIYGEIASSSSFTFSKTGVTVGRYKIAVAYSSGSSAMYINGNLISSNSTPFTFTSTLNDLNVGSRGGTSFIEQSRYNDIKLYKTRLSNSELATLTTI